MPFYPEKSLNSLTSNVLGISEGLLVKREDKEQLALSGPYIHGMVGESRAFA